MSIDYETKVYDLLKAYPELEEFIITLSPRYKKLKNPILRRTIARVASLRQAAMLGGFAPEVFVNLLRERVGLAPLTTKPKEERAQTKKPDWAEKTPAFEINANLLLDAGKNPLAEVSKKAKKLGADEIGLLYSDFIPSPLIDELKKQGFEAVTVMQTKGHYETYIRRI